GEEEDDIFTWERAIRTTSKIFNLDEQAQLKLICCRLRNKAANFMSNSLTEAPWLTSDEIINRLKKQFTNTNTNHKKLNQFLATTVVKTRKDYEEMLDLATDTFHRRSINEESLIRLTITKCPPMLRPMLLKFTINDGDWYEFLKEARQNAWVAFADEQCMFKEQFAAPDQIFRIKNEKSKNEYKKNSYKQESKKNCVIHGWCYHSTEDCKFIDILKKRETKRARQKKSYVNQIENENEVSSNDEQSEQDKLNKNNFYWCNFVNSNISKNNFLINLNTGKNTFYPALIDTGADVSLISQQMIPKGIPYFSQQEKFNLKSACGKQIPVLYKIK
ncbi:hypothetical protein GVAV_000024, partial [Gurleya vavrai]